MKYILLLLLFSVNIQASQRTMLKLLGTQEEFLHKNKIKNSNYILNRDLINIFIDFSNVKIKNKKLNQYYKQYSKNEETFGTYLLEELIKYDSKLFKWEKNNGRC